MNKGSTKILPRSINTILLQCLVHYIMRWEWLIIVINNNKNGIILKGPKISIKAV